LEKLISLAEAAVNEPSSFVTPSKTTAADSSQNEDISPSTMAAAQILTGGKLDPSKISKSPTAVAQRSVQTFDEEERKKSLADLSKSDSEYAKQVALTMETSHAAPAPQVPATGPLPSIERQRDLDDMIANFSNIEWMILMARVKDFLKLLKKSWVLMLMMTIFLLDSKI
nr:hypothetical protein [Tanacetum cinerariifolium]